MDDNKDGGEVVTNEEGLETETSFSNEEHVENSGTQAQPESDQTKSDDTPDETELGDNGESTQPGKDGEKDTGGEKGEDEGDKTFKGTKQADDPISRLNQENANYKKFVGNVQSLLNDPVQLREYLGELESEKGVKAPAQQAGQGQPAQPTVNEINDLEQMIEKMETVDDMKAVVKKMKDVFQKETMKGIQRVEDFEKKTQQSVQHQKFVQHVEKVGQNIDREIQSAYQKYPQLREKNPDGTKNPNFDPELDKLVGETFEKLDFDKNTGLYRGKVSFIEIADTIMNARGNGVKTGSRQAQTTIVDKRGGRIHSGTARAMVKPDESKMTPEQIIATRIQRMAKRATAKK